MLIISQANTYTLKQSNALHVLASILGSCVIGYFLFVTLSHFPKIDGLIIAAVILFFILLPNFKGTFININYTFKFEDDGSFYINGKYFCNYNDNLTLVLHEDKDVPENKIGINLYFKHGFGKSAKRKLISIGAYKSTISGLVTFLETNYQQVNIHHLEYLQLD